MSHDDKSPALIPIKGDEFSVKLALLKPANDTPNAANGKVSFTNPRKMMVSGKIEARGMDAENMDKLGNTLMKHTMLDPLLVRPMNAANQAILAGSDEVPTFYQIVNGERRWRRLKKAVAEKKPCLGYDRKMSTADKVYEHVHCHVRPMTDLEAYEFASATPGMEPSAAATASLAKYLHDCGVDMATIETSTNRSSKWVQETLKIMAMDEFCVHAYLLGCDNMDGGISRNEALKYAEEKDVARRVERCRTNIAKVQDDRASAVRAMNEQVTAAMENLDRKVANKVIAEYTGGDVDKVEAEIQTAETEVTRRKKTRDKVASTPAVVTGRTTRSKPNRSSGEDSGIGGERRCLTKKALDTVWKPALENLIQSNGLDKAGESLGVDLGDGSFVAWILELIDSGEKDIIGALRDKGRHTCAHAASCQEASNFVELATV